MTTANLFEASVIGLAAACLTLPAAAAAAPACAFQDPTQPALTLASRLRTATTPATAPRPSGTVPPRYRYVSLAVPDSIYSFVGGLNDAGTAVGFYNSGGASQPTYWEADGTLHTLGAPAGGASAMGINNAGEVFGIGSDDAGNIQLLRWNLDAPDAFEVLYSSSDTTVIPRAIGEDGTIVGYWGDTAATRVTGFVWTAADGIVDYGCVDPAHPEYQCQFSAISASGRIVGAWSDPGDPTGAAHALVAQAGTPAVSDYSAQTAAANSMINAINANDLAVGHMDVAGTGTLVPVTFAPDGTVTPLPAAASFGSGFSSAAGINGSGTIVGYAQDATNTLWVDEGGEVLDLLAATDDPGSLTPSNTVAINAGGSIAAIGVSIVPFAIQSFVLVPIPPDAIFADGFDSASH